MAGLPLPGAPVAGAPPPAPPPAPSVEPTPVGPISRLTSNGLRLKVAIGAGAILLVVIGWLVSGPLLAGMESSNQTTALQQTGTDMTKLDAFLVDTQVRDSKKTDSASLKVAIDAYQVKLTEADSTLAADQDRLDSLNRDIDFYSIFTPFQSSKVHANDGTIRHAKAALNAVAKAVSIWRTELAFYSALAGAEANADSADRAARNKDLTSTSDYYQKANALLIQCQLLVKDADVPPQFVPLIDAYSKVMKDVAGLADSLRAQDLPGVITYLQQLIADDTVIEFDQSAYLAWYSEKFNPLLKDYRANAVAVPRFVVTTTKLV